MDFYPNIMRNRVPLCISVSLLRYTQMRVKMVIKTFGLIHTQPKHFVRARPRVRQAYGIYEVVAHKTIEIFIIFFAVEKPLTQEMDIGFSTKSPAINLAFATTMAIEIGESIDLMVNQATSTPLRVP